MKVKPRFPTKRRWPITVLITLGVWAFLTLAILTPALDGHETNEARGLAQVSILAVIATRVVIAHLRCEENRVWFAYAVLLACAAPLWILIVEPLWGPASRIWDSSAPSGR